MTRFHYLALLISLCLSLGACQKKPKTGSDTYNDGFGYGDFDGGAGGAGAGGGDSTALPERDGSYSFYGPGSGNVMKGQFSPVYFAFDSFQVSGGEMSKVQEVASHSRRSGAKILVAGFTDAVGTEEYNRGLGDRRALAVRSALLQAGVSASKIQTVSFGEEMLADPSNPSSGQNRRVEFGIVR